MYGCSNPFSLTAFPGIGSPVAELGVIAYLRLHDEIGSDIASNSTIILNGSKDRYQVTGAGKIEYLDADPRTLSVRGTGSS